MYKRQFLNCRYSERKVIKKERIEKILVSAVKQSLKASMPVLNEMTDFIKFVSRDFKGHKFIAHCYEGEKPLLKDILRSGEDALVMIGCLLYTSQCLLIDLRSESSMLTGRL